MLMPSILGESLFDDFFEDFARPVKRVVKYNQPTVAVMRTDVKESDSYSEAVGWAVENNITSGTSAATFSPDAGCTRGQIMTFLYRFLG